MRKVNKKWSHIDHGDYIELKWRDKSVLIDPDDYWIFEECRLRIIKGSTKKRYESNKPYLYIVHGSLNEGYTYETFHRSIMNCPDEMIVDHINHETLDNRKSNLRICNYSLNLANSYKGTRKKKSIFHSKYKGVFKNGKKWSARCGNCGKRYLGVFETEIEAARAYNKAAKELYGEYALLNDLGES